ncbi:MAG: o-succinylbenzoate synthase [Flavobacteriales bacterium]
MLKAEYCKRSLRFKEPAGTSRGTLTDKPSWFIFVHEEENPVIQGVGECSLIPHLSPEWDRKLEKKVEEVCSKIEEQERYIEEGLRDWPALRFALETALQDLHKNASKELFPSAFTSGAKPIPINGLIWMDEPERMHEQIEQKIGEGFDCIKLKIGARDWEAEKSLLQSVREKYSSETIQLRVDANGAFSKNEAFEILETLKALEVHSIEQPIAPGAVDDMAELCRKGAIPVALDEELIGVNDRQAKRELIEKVLPGYLVLKPSLVGGFKGGSEWLDLAHEFGIGWWMTSALESNIGLNAIAQWCYKFKNPLYQGLGTGGLFIDNVDSPLKVDDGHLWYDAEEEWDLRPLFPTPEAF